MACFFFLRPSPPAPQGLTPEPVCLAQPRCLEPARSGLYEAPQKNGAGQGGPGVVGSGPHRKPNCRGWQKQTGRRFREAAGHTAGRTAAKRETHARPTAPAQCAGPAHTCAQAWSRAQSFPGFLARSCSRQLLPSTPTFQMKLNSSIINKII